MIRKTDRYIRRRVHVGKLHDDADATIRRETWWLLWVLPIYTRESVYSQTGLSQ